MFEINYIYIYIFNIILQGFHNVTFQHGGFEASESSNASPVLRSKLGPSRGAPVEKRQHRLAQLLLKGPGKEWKRDRVDADNFLPGNLKQPFLAGCFNWMIPNLYLENGSFTKHPFKTGCLGFQVVGKNLGAKLFLYQPLVPVFMAMVK